MTFDGVEVVANRRDAPGTRSPADDGPEVVLLPAARRPGRLARRPGRLLGALRVALAALFLGAAPVMQVSGQEQAAAEQAVYSDEEVKAAFLYNFGTYVQWPPVERSEEFLTIAMLGAPSIAAELERFVQGRTIQGRPVRVRRLRTINDLGDAEVLFIGADENWRLAQLIGSIEGRPTLIVSDAPDGLSDGAMVNFQLIDRRVRFEIALRPAQDAGLMLSSRLLSAALRVETTRCHAECRNSAVAESPRYAKVVRRHSHANKRA